MHRNIRLAILLALSTAIASGSSAFAATGGSGGTTPQAAASSASHTEESTSAGKKSSGAPSSEPTAPGKGDSCPGANLRPNGHNLVAAADATICLINRARLTRHIGAVAANEALDASAAQHSEEMHADRFFGHDSASGKTPREQVLATAYHDGASDVAAAQNVAWGSGSEATPRKIVMAWMASPSHRALLLSTEYHDIGVGASLGSPRGSASGVLYTADLARRHLVHPSVGGSSRAGT